MLDVLRLVRRESAPPRAHELLQELRDISSMAMEHFDEKIVPGLKRRMPALSLPFSTGYSSKSLSPLGTFFRSVEEGEAANASHPVVVVVGVVVDTPTP